MKPASTVIPTHRHPLDAAGLPWARRRLVARRRLPTMSVVPLGRGPLDKLAWIFGFGR